MLSAVLVGVLTLRFQEARVRAALLDVQQHRARHERALRELLQAVSGPYDQAAFLQRAAQALLEYSGAASVVLGAVSKAMLRHPYSTARNETALDAGLLRPGQRLSTLFLASSAGSRQVWAVQDGEILLTRLPRPGDDDILMILSRPQVSVDEVEQAIVVLGPMLEHTGLPEAVREDQVRLARHTHLIRDLVYAFSHDLRTPLMANALTIRNALKGAYGPLPEDYRDT